MSVKLPLYRRGIPYVFVCHHRLSRANVATPGQSCEGLREFHLRSLHRRRRIGPKGHPWTDEMIAHIMGEKKSAKTVAPERLMTKLPSVELTTMEHLGNGQWLITKGDYTEEVHFKKKAQTRCKELDETG